NAGTRDCTRWSSATRRKAERRGRSIRSSIFEQTLLPEIGDEIARFALDAAFAVVEPLLQALDNGGFVAARVDLANNRGGDRIKRVHLFGARLEQDAAEFLLAELDVF